MWGERLRAAREYRGLTQTGLATRAGVARESVCRWETDSQVQLDAGIKARLAAALAFPVAFLEREPPAGALSGSLRFRAARAMPQRDVAALERRAQLVDDLVSVLEPAVSWRSWNVPCPRSGVGTAEAALVVRDALEFGPEEPIGHLTRAVETAGAVVVALDWHDETTATSPSARAGRRAHHDAFSTWIGPDRDRPLIATSRVVSWDRARWSIAHEVGHLVLHRHRDTDNDAAREEAEAAANELACELLFPVAVLTRHLRESTTIDELVALKLRWGMSVQAIIEHGWRNGLISDHRRTSLHKQLSNRGWRLQEPGHDRVPLERPRALAKAIEVVHGRRPGLAQLSPLVGHWPVDALAETLRTQTSAPPTRDSDLVNLNDARRQRRAVR